MNIQIGTPIEEVNRAIASEKEISFERGGTWRGMIHSQKSDVVFSAYGEGPRPIITPRMLLPNADRKSYWTDMGGNIWRFALPGNSQNTNYRFWIDGIEHKRSETGAVTEDKRTSYNVNREFFFYLYSKGNPVCAYEKIEFSGFEPSAFIVSNSNNVHLKELDIRAGAGGSLEIDFSNHVIVEDCLIGVGSAKQGIRSNGLCDDVTIRHCLIDSDDVADDFLNLNSVSDGIYLQGGCSNWKIYKNTVRDWGHSCVEVSNTTNAHKFIRGIDIYQNFLTAENSDYCRGIGFDSLVGREAFDNKVRKNYIYKTSVQNQLNCPFLEFFGNVINKTRNSLTGEKGVGRGIVVAGYSNTEAMDMYIKNNIIAHCESEGLRLSHAAGYGPLVSNLFSGNIFYENGTKTPFDLEGAQVIFSGDGIGQNYFEGNFFKCDQSRAVWNKEFLPISALGETNINANQLQILDIDQFVKDNL